MIDVPDITPAEFQARREAIERDLRDRLAWGRKRKTHANKGKGRPVRDEVSGRVFATAQEAARAANVTKTLVYRSINRKVAVRGFQFAYAEASRVA